MICDLLRVTRNIKTGELINKEIVGQTEVSDEEYLSPMIKIIKRRLNEAEQVNS
jgi:hypothetical protein